MRVTPHLRRASAMLAGIAATASMTSAYARPPGVQIFCDVYEDAVLCTQQQVSCNTCHTAPPNLNPYGTELFEELTVLDGLMSEAAFSEHLPEALGRIAGLDSDGDGQTNLEEITQGTLPGDAESVRQEQDACARVNVDTSQQAYRVCTYDERLVLRRVLLDVCGRSVTRDELEALDASADRLAYIDGVLDGCFDSDFWQGANGQLWQLSYPKVRPRQPFAAANTFNADFNLFVYTQTDDRDARDLLLADYYVDRDDSTRPPRYSVNPGEGPRFTQPERRAGMLTQSWFHASNTMGQALPRVAAAQAYRAYLGYDLSVPEGIFPAAEPLVDYDSKDVDAPECAVCHTTLDPLAYMFSRYTGAGEPPGASRFERIATGRYNPDRLAIFVGIDGDEKLLQTPEQGALFGEPMADLVTWARAASQSDAFARHLVADYWELFVGHRPLPDETDEFTQLWQDFKTVHDYRVERMIHALIRTEAYGVP